jgi:hypothetical protein
MVRGLPRFGGGLMLAFKPVPSVRSACRAYDELCSQAHPLRMPRSGRAPVPALSGPGRLRPRRHSHHMKARTDPSRTS